MHANLGNEYLRQGRTEAARKQFEIVFGIYPDYPDALADYALTESWKGNQQNAEKLLLKALSLIEESNLNYPFVVVSLAMVWAREGKYEQAGRLLDTVIERWPSYAPAWSERSAIHQERGQVSAAITDAEAALRLNPGNAQAQSVLKLLSGDVSKRSP